MFLMGIFIEEVDDDGDSSRGWRQCGAAESGVNEQVEEAARGDGVVVDEQQRGECSIRSSNRMLDPGA
ncbi:MAG: hypothetical protein AAF368_19330 [Planctomycetota bacterium]